MQEMGDALLGGVLSLSEELAHRQATADVRSSEGQTAEAAAEHERAGALERAVYWDVLGLFMVVYPDHLADVYHNVPLALILLAPLVSHLLGSGPSPTPTASKKGSKQLNGNPNVAAPKGSNGTAAAAATAATAAATAQSDSLTTLYCRLFGASLRTMCSMVLAIVCAAGLGAARAAISGELTHIVLHPGCYCCIIPSHQSCVLSVTGLCSFAFICDVMCCCRHPGRCSSYVSRQCMPRALGISPCCHPQMSPLLQCEPSPIVVLLATERTHAFLRPALAPAGKPMIWFAQHWVGSLIYLPVSAAGALLPWLGVFEAAEKAAPRRCARFVLFALFVGTVR